MKNKYILSYEFKSNVKARAIILYYILRWTVARKYRSKLKENKKQLILN